MADADSDAGALSETNVDDLPRISDETQSLTAISASADEELQLQACSKYFVIQFSNDLSGTEQQQSRCCSNCSPNLSINCRLTSIDPTISPLYQEFCRAYRDAKEVKLNVDGLTSRSRIILLYNIMMAKCERLPISLPAESEFWQINECTIWWMDKLPCKLVFANLEHTIRQQPVVRGGRRQSLAQIGNLAYPEGGDYKAIKKRLLAFHQEIEDNGKDPCELARLLINSRRSGEFVTAEDLKQVGCRSTKSDVDMLNRLLLLLDIEVVRRLHSFSNPDQTGFRSDDSVSLLRVANEFDAIPVAVGIARFLQLCELGQFKVGEIFMKPGCPLFNDNPYHRITAWKQIEESYSTALRCDAFKRVNYLQKLDCDDSCLPRKTLSNLLLELEFSYGV